MVDEEFQGRGIATFLVNYMTEIAKERGVKGFQADVLLSNLPMIKVFESVPYVLTKRVAQTAWLRSSGGLTNPNPHRGRNRRTGSV